MLSLIAANQLGGKFLSNGVDRILAILRNDIDAFKWRVAVSDVFLFPDPIPLPTFDPGIERMTTSYNLSAGAFGDLMNSIGGNPPAGGETAAAEFPEGAIAEGIHRGRERSPALVSEAKARFRAKYGKLFCEACGFDFSQIYGEDYIEAHHKKPLSSFTGGQNVTSDDLAMVCANCHRMFHRRRPWIETIEEFQMVFDLNPRNTRSNPQPD